MIDAITAEGLAVMHDVTRTDKDEDGNKVEVTETVPYVEAKKIMQPFGDRSKVVIEPMLTDQWFVDTDKIVGPALDAVRDGASRSCPRSAKRSITTGWKTSSPGASRASFGGATRFRFGMGQVLKQYSFKMVSQRSGILNNLYPFAQPPSTKPLNRL